MANTTKYLVTTDNGAVEEFANLGLVGKFLGHKVTKKDIEAGKYPMVAVSDVEEDEEVGVDTEPVEDTESGMEVPDDSTGFDPEPELDQHTKEVLVKIEQAINDTPEEDAVLFDALCGLEDSIRDGINLTDEQATLLTAILTGTLVTQPLTNTDSEDDSDNSDTDTDEDGNQPAPPSDIEYPEVGDFKDEKAMKKFIKSLSDQSLQEWCILEGVEWKVNDHEAINRMRMAMAIKAKHFPTTAPTKGKKSKGKYSHYALEDLVQMAMDNDIEVPDDKGDNRILRMYTIMALRKAGLIE